MSIIQDIINFEKSLDASQRVEFELGLQALMAELSDAPLLSPEQEADLEKRLNDPNPTFATQAEIDSVFSRPLPQ